MKHQYGEFDGQPFLGPDDLFPPDQVMQFILQHGQQALDAMNSLDDQDEQDFIEQLIQAGLLERDEDGDGNLKLTPKMVRGLEHKALLDIFEGLHEGNRDGHSTDAPGRTTERTEGTKAYDFGDPLSEIDLGQTFRNAIKRQAREAPGQPVLPIGVGFQDFELYNTESTADCATVILIDQSGSMMRYGRFYQAKRVALGMASLIRQRFPQDRVEYVGFYSLADRLKPMDLPLVMPKPVTIHEYEVRLRCPLDKAYANKEKVPLHFTNLQLGLREARRILARSGAANKQVFIITDGQPTAHVEPGEQGDTLFLLYPPDQRTADATLAEAHRCKQQGIRLASFALIEDYWGMDWVSFIEQITRLTRGIAYYCTSENLSSTVIESYLTGRKRKSFVG